MQLHNHRMKGQMKTHALLQWALCMVLPWCRSTPLLHHVAITINTFVDSTDVAVLPDSVAPIVGRCVCARLNVLQSSYLIATVRETVVALLTSRLQGLPKTLFCFKHLSLAQI